MSPGEQGISLGGTGDIDMYPAQTSAAIDELQRTADAFARFWPSRLAEIRAHERSMQTGFDQVSVNFRAGYNQIEPRLSERTTAFAPKLLGAASRGKTVVARYVEAFQAMTDIMRPR